MTPADDEATPLRRAREAVGSRQALLTSATRGRRFYRSCGGGRRHAYMSVGEPGEEEHPRLLGRIYGSSCARRPRVALVVAVTAAVAVLGWWTVGAKEIWILKNDNSDGMFEV